MLNKTNNYEEAKIILQNSINDDNFKNKIKIARLRALFATGIATVAATAVGITSGDYTLGIAAFPTIEGLLLPVLIPYILLSTTKRRIKHGSYFEDNSMGKIISTANKYVDEYNEFEQKNENEGKVK